MSPINFNLRILVLHLWYINLILQTSTILINTVQFHVLTVLKGVLFLPDRIRTSSPDKTTSFAPVFQKYVFHCFCGLTTQTVVQPTRLSLWDLTSRQVKLSGIWYKSVWEGVNKKASESLKGVFSFKIPVMMLSILFFKPNWNIWFPYNSLWLHIMLGIAADDILKWACLDILFCRCSNFC